jgi:hypothetical protein
LTLSVCIIFKNLLVFLFCVCHWTMVVCQINGRAVAASVYRRVKQKTRYEGRGNLRTLWRVAGGGKDQNLNLQG